MMMTTLKTSQDGTEVLGPGINPIRAGANCPIKSKGGSLLQTKTGSRTNVYHRLWSSSRLQWPGIFSGSNLCSSSSRLGIISSSNSRSLPGGKILKATAICMHRWHQWICSSVESPRAGGLKRQDHAATATEHLQVIMHGIAHPTQSLWVETERLQVMTHCITQLTQPLWVETERLQVIMHRIVHLT